MLSCVQEVDEGVRICLPYQELVKIWLRKNGEDGMYKFEGYEIAVPHFYCLEYYEGGKKMIVEMDFREDYFFLGPQLITHWEEPYEDIIIEMEEKKRILLNIREFLLTKTIPSHIIWI